MLRLRQICLVARQLQPAVAELESAFGLTTCYHDPGVGKYGLENALLPIGNNFLEIVAPVEDNTAAGRYLDRRGGDGGYMVITQVDNVARRRARVAELGVRIAFDLDYPDDGHDGIQLHPGDTGGSFFEMDQMLMPGGDEVGGPWYPAGKNWEPYVNTSRVSSISAAELQSPEPDRLAQRWAEIAEIDLTADANGNPIMQLDNAILRFVEDSDGRGEGLGGIDVVVTDRAAILDAADRLGCAVSDDQVAIAGLRVNLT